MVTRTRLNVTLHVHGLTSSPQQNPDMLAQASIWVISPQTERPKCEADCARSVRLRDKTFVHNGQFNT